MRRVFNGLAVIGGKRCPLVVESERCRDEPVCLKLRGGLRETNEHADRFNQRSPSGQLPLLAHWSRPELSSQTHHSMSKLPSNMSACHSTCRTVWKGWGNRRQPHDKATWSALQTGQAARPPATLQFGGHSMDSQCQLLVSESSLTDRCLCL